MTEYRHKSSRKDIVVHSYNGPKDQINAIYASRRPRLPFEVNPALRL